MRSTMCTCCFIYLFIFKRAYSILVPWGPTAVNDRLCTKCKRNRLIEVVQYKTACSWSLLLLHNTVGGVLWVKKRECDALHL